MDAVQLALFDNLTYGEINFMARKAEPKSVFGANNGMASTGEAWTVLQAADYDIVRNLVVAASRAGGTVQFGTTRNGTAVTLRIYHNGVGENFYAGDTDTLHDLCLSLIHI